MRHAHGSPTAYVFPDTYDRVSPIKGPQTVLYGPGNSAATVLLNACPPATKRPAPALKAALTTAGFGRTDAQIDARAGTPQAYVRHCHRCPLGRLPRRTGHFVHAAYERSSLTGLVAGRRTRTHDWKPAPLKAEDTRPMPTAAWTAAALTAAMGLEIREKSHRHGAAQNRSPGVLQLR